MTFKIENVTPVSNIFIDRYLSKAPSAYVVVYIYALRHCSKDVMSLSNEQIAKELDLLESDVIKAFKYWQEKGVIQMQKDNRGISFVALEENTQAPKQKNVIMERPPAYSPEEISVYLEKSQIVKEMFLSAQDHLGKLLSHNDMSILFSFYDWLRLPMDVIEILLAYCTQNGHRNLRYIEKVAINWADEGIDSAQRAVEYIKLRNNGYREIMRAFGQGNRTATPTEENYMKKWTSVYKLPVSIIKKACEKTVLQTGQTSFQYADTILTSWYKNDVKTEEDIKRMEEEFAAAKKAKTAQNAPAKNFQKPGQKEQNTTKKNRFVNYEQRQWDFEEMERMERELLKKELNQPF